MPFTFNFHKYAGSAMHQFEMPGRPVSHSCVRQFEDDAEWIYNWGQVARYNEDNKLIPYSGTPLIVLNVFDFTRTKGGPWLELKSNKDYFIDLPAKPLEVEEALIPWCHIPKAVRGVIPNRARYIGAEAVLRERGIIRPHIELIETQDFNLTRRIKAKEQEKKRLEEEEKRRLLEEAQENLPIDTTE
jgi:hypothetical protein